MYAVSSLSGSLAVGHSRAVPNSAVCRDAQSDGERRLTERYRTEPLPASTLDVIVPATTQNATALRRTFRRWIGSLIADDVAEDLTLAVYEALTNVAAWPAMVVGRTPRWVPLPRPETHGQPPGRGFGCDYAGADAPYGSRLDAGSVDLPARH
jgi:hypothetical protein